MNMKVVFVVFLCCVNCNIYRIKRQTPWYAFVDCFQNDAGMLHCEKPKTIITPYENNYRHNYPYNYPHNYPTQNPPVFRQNEQSPIVSSPSFVRHSPAINQDTLIACGPEEYACISPYQCISKQYLCDGKVNCIDASDEQNCSCISRLNPSKICDSYHDCPDGSDEMGCFGCSDSYSCHNEYDYITNSSQSRCYTDEEKCNGVNNCPNRKDETGCLLLTAKKNSSPDLFVRSTDGFLYLNRLNRWYPVCKDPSYWAKQVCEYEQGVRLSDESIRYNYEPFIYDGQYLSSNREGLFALDLVENCSVPGIEPANAILHVKCPDVCGARINFENKKSQSRIAGGKEAVPGSHPWLVALQMNGKFICGGTIIGQKFILTAAHCLKYKRRNVTELDYLEVRAGVQRQTSFSPQEQAIQVLRAVIHFNYDTKSFKSDIALLELNEPLLYNRWVQPICLPTQERVSNETDANWLWKPDNTTCLTAGWGGFTDRGPNPVENLMEVELPIAPFCDPNNAEAFCAGHPQGGFDTCIGDSGGPFACRSNTNHMQFYLAGITSSGYSPTKKKKTSIRCGEPNNFTTFTRVALFADWIDEMKLNRTNGILFRAKCPGVLCRSNNRCVIALNGIADCLDGEDEIYEKL